MPNLFIFIEIRIMFFSRRSTSCERFHLGLLCSGLISSDLEERTIKQYKEIYDAFFRGTCFDSRQDNSMRLASRILRLTRSGRCGAFMRAFRLAILVTSSQP